MPPARSHPYAARPAAPARGRRSRCANLQPASTARRSIRFGGSSRSGRELISTALSKRAAAANTIVGVERRTAAGAVARDSSGRCSGPGRRGAGWRAPSPSAASWSSCHPQLRVHAADHDVQPAEQLGVWSSAPSSGCPPRCRSGSGTAPAPRSAPRPRRAAAPGARGEPVGDRQPRRVVGQHHVLVAELARRLGHLPDRRAAVATSRNGRGSRRAAPRSAGRPSRRSAGRRSPPAAAGRPAPRRAATRRSSAPSPRRCRSGSRSVAAPRALGELARRASRTVAAALRKARTRKVGSLATSSRKAIRRRSAARSRAAATAATGSSGCGAGCRSSSARSRPPPPPRCAGFGRKCCWRYV